MKARQGKAGKGKTLRLFYPELFLRNKICSKITPKSEKYTKYTRVRKSTNPYLQKDHICLN